MRWVLLGCIWCACWTLASASSPQPSWDGPIPSTDDSWISAHQIPGGVRRSTIYNATTAGAPNPFGTYNHGPIITFQEPGTFLVSWYNSPRDETLYKRPAFATSLDGVTWSDPAVLFPNYTTAGQENGPWTNLDGRLYAQCGTQDAGNHIETIVSVMRRVHVDTPGSVSLGPVFWLNRTVPAGFEHLGLPTYLEMDLQTRADAERYLGSAVRTLVKPPDSDGSKMVFNERSVYLVPGSRLAVNLLRGGTAKSIYSSSCTLPQTVPTVSEQTAWNMTLFSCRPGVGDRFTQLIEIAQDGATSNASQPRTCDWSPPVVSNIPDAHSRTCAAPLPALQGIYMVGSQNPHGRDPLVLSVARDGLRFEQQWAVRFGAPAVRYPGVAKGRGFQYPGSMIHLNRMYVTYSVGKEDIEVSQFDLASLLA